MTKEFLRKDPVAAKRFLIEAALSSEANQGQVGKSFAAKILPISDLAAFTNGSSTVTWPRVSSCGWAYISEWRPMLNELRIVLSTVLSSRKCNGGS